MALWYYIKKTKHVLTVYDLIKELFYESNFKKEIKNKKEYFKDTDGIICISHNTKKDLINYYGIDKKK